MAIMNLFMSKKPIFSLRNCSTKTSLAALSMIGAEGYLLTLSFKVIAGNIFLSTSLKKIMNKNIDNNKVLKNIKNIYEKFLIKAKDYSYLKLKRIYNKT